MIHSGSSAIPKMVVICLLISGAGNEASGPGDRLPFVKPSPNNMGEADVNFGAARRVASCDRACGLLPIRAPDAHAYVRDAAFVGRYRHDQLADPGNLQESAMVDEAQTPTNDDDAMMDQTGKGGGGESGGGAYPNPHTGKEKRGGSATPFKGGQSDNRYFGSKDAQGNSAKHAGRDKLASDDDGDEG